MPQRPQIRARTVVGALGGSASRCNASGRAEVLDGAVQLRVRVPARSHRSSQQARARGTCGARNQRPLRRHCGLAAQARLGPLRSGCTQRSQRDNTNRGRKWTNLHVLGLPRHGVGPALPAECRRPRRRAQRACTRSIGPMFVPYMRVHICASILTIPEDAQSQGRTGTASRRR